MILAAIAGWLAACILGVGWLRERQKLRAERNAAIQGWTINDPASEPLEQRCYLEGFRLGRASVYADQEKQWKAGIDAIRKMKPGEPIKL